MLMRPGSSDEHSMVNLLSRRRVLASSTVALGALAGCFGRSSQQRTLIIELHSVSESDGEYTINMSPRVTVVGDWEPFRDVTVIGKTKEGSVVCRRELGDITQVGDAEPVTFTCDGLPYTLTYEIAGDPCAGDTTVQKMVYVPEENDWTPRDIEC